MLCQTFVLIFQLNAVSESELMVVSSLPWIIKVPHQFQAVPASIITYQVDIILDHMAINISPDQI